MHTDPHRSKTSNGKGAVLGDREVGWWADENADTTVTIPTCGIACPDKATGCMLKPKFQSCLWNADAFIKRSCEIYVRHVMHALIKCLGSGGSSGRWSPTRELGEMRTVEPCLRSLIWMCDQLSQLSAHPQIVGKTHIRLYAFSDYKSWNVDHQMPFWWSKSL
jgi:hypothetical protein